MAGGSAIRGSRVGSSPSVGYSGTAETAPRRVQTFWCARGHESVATFAHDAEVPGEWDCPRCGFPAGTDRDNPPDPPRTEPYKTHLAYVKERRSDADGEAILEEALQSLRARRGEG